MTHSAANDDIRDRAALYALGALPPDEEQDFEAHLSEGCQVCRKEVQAFVMVSGNLGFAADNAEPPPEMHDRLLARIAVERNSQINSVRADQGEWEQMLEGVMVKTLHQDETTGLRTSLVRMSPGARLPAHRHIGVEQFYILEGDCHVQGELLGPGDFHIAESNTVHDSTSTVNGTLFLLIGPKGYEILQQDR